MPAVAAEGGRPGARREDWLWSLRSIPRPVLSVVMAAGVCWGGLTASAATPLGARESISAHDLKRHAAFLASDTLEGRAAGTRGGQAAASYLAREFGRLKLSPAGDGNDFLQEFGPGYRNVLALLPGSHPRLSHEVILVGGHFDHVGYGNRSNSYGPYGQIHNGADDNASGAAAILEVAEALADLDEGPPRSILFALWDAEEAGMLGSQHWAHQPTVALDRIRLVINLDMVGRLRNDRISIYGIRTGAGFRQLASLANRSAQLQLEFDWTHRNDSDHWTFLQKQIPYLMLHTGEHEDYHRPSDDVDKLNFPGMERVARMVYELVLASATADSLPGFRRESLAEGPAEQRAQNRPMPAVPRLGISWNPHRAPGDPFEITGVVPASPADHAGLRPGDRVLRIDGRMPDEIHDLAAYVASSDGQVHLVVEGAGGGSQREVPVQLRGIPDWFGIHWRSDAAEPQAMIVTAVAVDSPAARAGIAIGDRLFVAVPGEWTGGWIEPVSRDDVSTRRLVMERAGRLTEVLLDSRTAPSSSPSAMAD